VFGGTADFRTDVYQGECERIPTHDESIQVIRSLGGKFTPELKFPSVAMPFGTFTQRDFAAKMINEYKAHNILPEHVWPQSATLEDIEYIVKETEYGAQAVVLDFGDDRVAADDAAFLQTVASTGAKIVAPPVSKKMSYFPQC
jgi:glycerophosphoryl diester phosphodiesterase